MSSESDIATPLIELRQVSKSYDDGRTVAVQATDLQVFKGELLVLIGESGCGKTTTLKMINRLEEPSAGEVFLDGSEVRSLDAEHLRRNIGYVFQGIGLFPHYTVADNIAVVPRLHRWSEERIAERVEQTLDLVNLPAARFAERFPDQLSGGQQQRVGVARALAAQPELLLMDEPFGALDPVTRSELQEEFKQIQQQLNLTAVMVTHDMTEALLLADRIAVMKTGELLQVGSPVELLNQPQHAYVEEILALPKRRADQLEQLLHAPGDQV